MAVATSKVSSTFRDRSPAVLRAMAKPRQKFLCSYCFQEVTGWIYYVGFDPFHKVESCALCWAEPRIPPMKPVGSGVILG